MWEILRNPKYTGYQVWNRRARKTSTAATGQPTRGVGVVRAALSPAHHTRQEYDQVRVKAASNARSRRDGTGQPPGPNKAEYLFRGRLLCGDCGLRMKGNRGTFSHYRCHITMQRATKIPWATRHDQPQRAIPAPGDPRLPGSRSLWPRPAQLLATGAGGGRAGRSRRPSPPAPGRGRAGHRRSAAAAAQPAPQPRGRRPQGGGAAPHHQPLAELEQAIADHQASLAKLQRELDLPVAALDVLATDARRVRDSGPCPGRDSNARPTA